MLRRILLLKAVAWALIAAWWFVGRPWTLRWGSTDEERSRSMPGYGLAPEPNYETTRAITIEAGPEDVWPWLVQLGKGRGGLYSIDWLDRLFGFLDAPSAEEVLPEFQRLQVGDVIPLGRGPGWPVVHVDECRCLALGGENGGTRWSWVFGLYASDDRQVTRLVSRNRVSAPPGVGRLLMLAVVEPPAFIMTATMLRGIKRRAERLAAQRRAAEAAISVLR
jgi:hypothetical protein